ncbi:hypothetical protein HYU15_01665 [Candidatus Woesearchaeota archaeon]|nr:hypothetical protein [Candidatus Woesearchaeota archaeon]
MRRKSQVWFTDLILGVVIFFSVLLLYMRVSSNLSDTDERLLEELKSDSAHIAASFAGAGYPDGWNSLNVQKPGLTGGSNILNQTKAASAASINYSNLKVLMGTRNDFFAFFEDKSGNVISISGVCGIGKLAVANITAEICANVSVSAKFLARSERLVYRNGALKLVVYSWRT